MSKIASDVLPELAGLMYDGDRPCIVRIARQLDPKLYKRVNEVLESFGGKWNRGKKGHLFENSPQDDIETALVTGEFVKSSEFDFFETPPAVVDLLLGAADLEDGHEILEPSAGRGAIARAIRAARPRASLVTCEIRPDNAAHLQKAGFRVNVIDFLKYEQEGWDRIVMNPPFSRQQDIDHVFHAYDLLNPGGRLVAVMAAGVTFRDNLKTVRFRELAEGCGSMVPLPSGSFKSSGTMVETVLVTIDKSEEA